MSIENYSFNKLRNRLKADFAERGKWREIPNDRNNSRVDKSPISAKGKSAMRSLEWGPPKKGKNPRGTNPAARAGSRARETTQGSRHRGVPKVRTKPVYDATPVTGGRPGVLIIFRDALGLGIRPFVYAADYGAEATGPTES